MLRCGTWRGYAFALHASPDGQSYCAWAHPLSPDDGDRWFFLDFTGRIHYEVGRPVDASSPLADK